MGSATMHCCFFQEAYGQSQGSLLLALTSLRIPRESPWSDVCLSSGHKGCSGTHSERLYPAREARVHTLRCLCARGETDKEWDCGLPLAHRLASRRSVFTLSSLRHSSKISHCNSHQQYCLCTTGLL